MDATATFYLFPAERMLDFDAALAPREEEREVKSKLFFTRKVKVRVDGRQAFLAEAATSLSRFEGPGFAFSLLDRLLIRKGVSGLFANLRLASATASLALFDPARAQALLAALSKVKLTEEEIAAETGSRDRATLQHAFSALRELTGWLQMVQADSVGLLCVEERAQA